MPLRPPDSFPLRGPAAPRAPTPVRPVPSIARVAPSDATDLSRAGVDLLGVLAAAGDELVSRALPTEPELADVLERARAALVRGAAGEALAALDEAWEGALRTEGGWYYRAAALALLGLPGEADRVLEEALIRRGGSVALLFLQSVTRSAQGDGAGARAALSAALARRNGDVALLAWQSVLTARGGDIPGALAMLAPLLEEAPGSSVLAWARQAITAARAEATRAGSPTPSTGAPTSGAPAGDWQDNGAPRSGTPASGAPAQGTPAAGTSSIDAPPSRVSGAAPLERALRRLGERLADTPADDLRRDVRALLRTITVGGILDRTAQPAQIAVVRSVLADLLRLLERPSVGLELGTSGQRLGTAAQRSAPGTTRAAPGLDAQVSEDGQWRVTPPLAQYAIGTRAGNGTTPEPGAMRARLLEALCTGQLSLADRLLARAGVAESDVAAAVLRTLLDGARTAADPHAGPMGPEGASRTADAQARADAASADSEFIAPDRVLRTADRHDDPLLVPIRIGLSLLREGSARQEARAALAALPDLSLRTLARGEAMRTPGVALANWMPSEEARARAGEGAAAAFGAGGQAGIDGLQDARLDPAALSAAALHAAGLPLGSAAAAAAAAAAAVRSGTSADEAGAGMGGALSGDRLRALAFVCMLLAFVALLYGYGVLSIALAGGASWLALRASAAQKARAASREAASSGDSPR